MFAPLVLAMLAVLATPHGMSLLAAPWRPLGYLSARILELQPFELADLLTFDVTRMTPSFKRLVLSF